MKKIKKILAFILVCVFMMTGCGKDVDTFDEEETQEDEQDEVTYKLGFSCLTMDNPYFISLESSLRSALEEEGHTLITKDAKSDAEQQELQIDELIEEGVDAVFVSPVDWEKITPALEKLNNAGIKIINIDTQVQEIDKVDAFVGSDNSNAGYICGVDLVERLPQGGKIIIVECPNRNSISERIKGFEKAIAGNGFEVVARIDGKGDLDVAIPEVEAALQENPDVVAIMCGNDPTALGALVAANTKGNRDVLIYGIDGSPEVKEELSKTNSPLVATVAQSTIQIGQEAASVALKILNGEDYEKVTYIDTFLINSDNVAEYGTTDWQ